eukprot:3846718-Prorocentrum_lima.AAC.1
MVGGPGIHAASACGPLFPGIFRPLRGRMRVCQPATFPAGTLGRGAHSPLRTQAAWPPSSTYS